MDIISRVWLHRYKECRDTRLPEWLSSHHPKKLPCRAVGESCLDDQHGSFNLTCKVILADGEACAVRFPMIGLVKCCDEKVAREVAVINLIYHQTSVPVPKVIAWGLAADNTLGLGPFLITSYVEGISLGKILKDPSSDNARMMRQDISDQSIEKIYRQIAGIQPELSKLDFDRIGSPSGTGHEINGSGLITVSSRPFTMKSHEILHVGGINVFPERGKTFSSTAEYLKFVVEQDIKQLTQQLNSVDNEGDAADKYKPGKRYNC